jgi:HK97 family phage major capsid protein
MREPASIDNDLGFDLPSRGERFISLSDGGEDVVDEEKRTARFPISSETPVRKRGGYYEILDHSQSSVRLAVLQTGANVIMDHEAARVVGVVENAALTAERRVEVLARFSNNSDEARVVFADVRDRIRRNVSFGYNIYDGKREGTAQDGLPIVRITDWEAYEVTFTSVPADPMRTGLGRTKDLETIMKDDNETDIEDVTETRAAEPDFTGQLEEIEAEATKRERERQNEINAIAKQHANVKTLQLAAQSALAKGVSVDAFRSKALELIGKANLTAPTDLGMTNQEVQRYSLMRMLRAQTEAALHGRDPMKIAPFEYRCHLDQLERLEAKRADAVQGWLVPWDVQSRGGWSTRAVPADTTENAALVPEDHLADQFILGLRANSAVMMAGATTLTGLVGDVSIPREESIAVEWLTEDEDTTDVDYVTSSVTLSPTTVAGSVPITRRLMKQSSPDVDVVVRNNLVRGIAEEIDKQALLGDGLLGLPTGIRNLTNVLTQLIVTGGITWAEAVGFEGTVEATAQSLLGPASYIMRPEQKTNAKTTGKDAGSGLFIWENDVVNGYPAYSSVHAGGTANGIVFGTFSSLLIGFWGVLDVMSDVYTKAASGGVVIRVFQDTQVAARRDESFCIETLV